MTRDMEETARRYARPGTEIEGVTAKFGAPSIEGFFEEQYAILHFVETIQERAADFDAVILACYGDPGLYAAREVSPVPVIGIAEASMLMACTVAYKFSVVTVIPRVKPMIEHTVKLHGLESRCASVRTTPLSVLDCERDPTAAAREIIKQARAAIEEDGAEAILLGCGGMGPLDAEVGAAVPVPVIDGIVCAVKLAEGLADYGLKTSRLAAFKEPEEKGFIAYPGPLARV
jgi:allantoin racemase